ncbi:MAG: ferredoxin-NADP reductase [Pseudohongiellaceae bacterium]|jgi:ferredoxin-NADP reductase
MNNPVIKNLFSPTYGSNSFNFIQKLANILTNTAGFGVYIEPIIQLLSPNWKSGKISAEITAVRHESSNIYTLVLKPSSKWQAFKAGQFVQLSAEINGSLITRTFSISSEPAYFKTNEKIELTIRSQDQGLLTPWLQTTAKPGNTVYLSQANGDFILKNQQPKKLFIAAGSGITAIRPILKQYKNDAWFKDAQLLFYVKNRTESLFLEDLNALETYGLTYTYIYSEESGRICQSHLDEFCDNLTEREVYVCGPPKMIEATQQLLKENKVTESNIYFEYFGPPPLKMTDFSLNDDEEFIQVDYLNSKKQVSYKAEQTPKTLLDIAESEGLKPVSGCRIGVCHQCICKKKQGRVFNIKTKKYSDSGSEEIQLCLSVPVGHVELEL